MGVTASVQDGVSIRGNEHDCTWEMSLDTPYEHLSQLRPLAKGTACSCQHGKLGMREVAIKALKPNSSDADAEDLGRELSALQLLHHHHIVRLAGAGRLPQGGMFVATEFLSRGTLCSALGTDAPEGTTWIGRARVRMWFPLEEALRQAAGVASALAYMHDRAVPGAKVVHRDVKSTNLGFAADGTLKLFDFGLAKVLRPRDVVGDTTYKMTGNTGSLRYMAPEVANSLASNETVDVYSFAMVMWEMASVELPFQFYGVKELLGQVIGEGLRPRLAPEWPEGFRDTLTRCWSPKLSERPSMAEVEQRLRKLLETELSS